MGLGLPLCGAGGADPDGEGVVVEGPGLRFGVGVAGEGAEDVVGGEGGVRGEDADLKVA